ncbi:MAG: hypothetical protein N2379_10900 [Verrucomicrobiae bacterium]|nr:hypothetical protein [Verrucomicrobiae bacterium]
MLATVAQLKSVLGLPAHDVADDEQLEFILQAVTARFERETDRRFGYLSGAVYEFAARDTRVLPNRLPVWKVLRFEEKSLAADEWVEVQAPRLAIRHGVIYLAWPLPCTGPVARVIYDGGYILPGQAPVEGVEPLPADLQNAALRQAAYWWQRRNQLGLVSISGEGGAITQFASQDLLPEVVATLEKYQRFTF